MKTLHYLVRINKDSNSDWGALVLDLPGCVATGTTIDAALGRIQSAIALHLRGLREDGIKPPPHDIARLLRGAHCGWWIFMRPSRLRLDPALQVILIRIRESGRDSRHGSVAKFSAIKGYSRANFSQTDITRLGYAVRPGDA